MDGFQSCSKVVSGEQRWLRLRSLPRGARPLLLLHALLCLYANPLRLFANALVLKRGRFSEMREPLQQSIRYLRVCSPLTCRHEKEARCLRVCALKRL
jgi:hypothetical protein